MARQNKNHVEEYVLVPKKRWGRRFLWLMILVGVPVMVVWGNYWRGETEEAALFAEVSALSRTGEPMYVASFCRTIKTPEGQNAAPLLRGAADSIDLASTVWSDLDRLEVRPPLNSRERALIVRMVEQNRPALAMLAAARGKKAVDWYEYPTAPMCDTWLRGERQQWVLAQLVEANLLLAHERGDDREAIQGISDLLILAAAREQLLPGYSHEKAAAISSMASQRAIDVAPDLRIGNSDGMVEREEVLRVVAALADESALVEGQMQLLRWERATHAETPQLVQNNQVRPQRWRDLPMPMQVLVYAARPQAMSDARAILRLSTQILSVAQSSENWPAFFCAASFALDQIQEIDRNSGWQMIARTKAPDYQALMKEHYMRLAERRLAAAALAIRLYVVDHDGEFPKSLEALTPTYLAQVPRDPLARRGLKIQYVADPARPIIYSVGANGRDDGGSEVMPPNCVEYCVPLGEDAIAHLKRQERKKTERDKDEKLNLLGNAAVGSADAISGGSAKGGY